MSNLSVGEEEDEIKDCSSEGEHLDELADGAGCVEIWERLTEVRDSD